jgi:small subunit ribosomal protein S5
MEKRNSRNQGAKKRRDQGNSGISRDKVFDKEAWTPKTELGREVKAGKITDIDQILDQGLKILEPEIVDMLLPGLQVELLEIGQSKGKFGGGKPSIWRQTQKKTKEGNKPSFATVAVCGNENGYVGIGFGKAKETVPAREKAQRRAKLNLIKIRRGSGSWESNSTHAHSIPFTVKGKCSSVIVTLMPAPKGTRLCAEKQSQRILKLAGIKDIYMKARGSTKTKLNLVQACFNALKELGTMKVKPEQIQRVGIVGGRNE